MTALREGPLVRAGLWKLSAWAWEWEWGVKVGTVTQRKRFDI